MKEFDLKIVTFLSKLPSAGKDNGPVEKCLDEMVRSVSFYFFIGNSGG